MAWVTPTNAVAGAVVSSSLTVNPIIADIALLGGASVGNYGSAATVWKATGTDPVIAATGTFVARARQDSKWVDVFIQITMGSTTTYGVGTWLITLPVAARDTNWGGAYGRAYDVSASTTLGYRISVDAQSTTTLGLRCDATTAGNVDRTVGSTAPFTWATGDILTLQFRYEAA